MSTKLSITPVCTGNTPEHCCWVDGEVCRFLEIDTMPDRHWVCGLRRRLGSWEAVHNDPGYIEHVRPMWNRINPSVNCGDYPPQGEACASCVVGDR